MATSFNYTENMPIVEEVDSTELSVLDKESPTSIVDFMRMYAADRSFTPPEAVMIFDSDISDEIDLDHDEAKSLSYDFEDVKVDEDARARD